MSEKRDITLFIQDVFDSIDKINGYVSGMTDEKELKNDSEGVVWDSIKNDLPELQQIIKKVKGGIN